MKQEDIRKEIAGWYSGVGIIMTEDKRYEARLECINKFCKKHEDKHVYGELVGNFMGMPLAVESIEELIDMIHQKDKSFTVKKENEIRLLSGICLAAVCEKPKLCYVGIMIKLLYIQGFMPRVQAIFDHCMKNLDNLRIFIRKKSKLKIYRDVQQFAEMQMENWDIDTAKRVLTSMIKLFTTQQENINIIKDELKKKEEESDILWWVIARWSELYGKGIDDLNDCQAALAVPLELMDKVVLKLGPVAVFTIMKHVLLEHVSGGRRYSLKEYIQSAVAEVFDCAVKYSVSELYRYTPVLEALHRYRQNDDAWCVEYRKEFGIDVQEQKYSVLQIAQELYLESELCAYF